MVCWKYWLLKQGTIISMHIQMLVVLAKVKKTCLDTHKKKFLDVSNNNNKLFHNVFRQLQVWINLNLIWILSL
jgi:hypothetical protein